ncbi:Fc.00g091450.m01.CDS01 [Cosmosporella sp. VM-42]
MFARNALILVAAGFAAAQTTTETSMDALTTATGTSTVTGTVIGTVTITETGMLTETGTIISGSNNTASMPTTLVTSIGNGTVITTTRVVSAYTTYCPGPTAFDFNGNHYEVTGPTTLTISDCPCTIVEPCHTCKPGGGSAATHVPVPPSKPVNGGSGSEGSSSSGSGYHSGEGSMGSEGANGGQGSKGTQSGDEPVQIVSGAGAVQLSLGLAAAFGLLAL